MFVPNFIILCQAVPEKSLTEKKFTHTHTRTQTSSQKRQKLYTPYILRICRGYKQQQMSRRMRKPAICICENKDADQLHSNCEADQPLCFLYTDSTIPLLSKSKITSLYSSSVTVQPGLCPTLSEPKLFVFLRIGSN